MRISSFIVGIVFILVSLCGSFLEAFEIQFLSLKNDPEGTIRDAMRLWRRFSSTLGGVE